MVHNSNARIEVLSAFILEHVADYRSHFEISDVKQDGTVFVKFRGTAAGSFGATPQTLGQRFGEALKNTNRLFQQLDVHKFRLALDQF